jgi:hypothetical protein
VGGEGRGGKGGCVDQNEAGFAGTQVGVGEFVAGVFAPHVLTSACRLMMMRRRGNTDEEEG